MKKIITILLISVFANGFSQSNYYRLDGTVIDYKDNRSSINNIRDDFFSDAKIIKTYWNNNIKECEGYVIIFQKYTKKALFINGEFPKEKYLKKCLDKAEVNVVSDYHEHDSYQFKSDLDSMIEQNKNKEYVISVFGEPGRETIDKDKDSEIVIFNYNRYYGTVIFDLVFVDNILNRYIISN